VRLVFGGGGERMTWRQVGIGVLLMPVVAGTVLLVAVLVVCKLPAFCCERCRAVR